ncbi:MAG: hypothetical protein QUV05_03300 [Phycisphaerae bacterium]|nr:hypothetical protein [Phycisphaerae bacterium]
MRHRFIGLAAAGLGLALSGCAAWVGGERGGPIAPLKPGVAQLFVDDELIESQQGLERRLHCPVKDNGGNEPIIAAPAPRTTILAYGSIVFDTKLKKYVMFSQGFVERHMYRFTSEDGLNWDTGKGVEFEEITFGPPPEMEPGAVGRPGIDVFSCFYDTRDAEWPYKGWLYYANYGPNREGIYYVRSRDGRKWDRLNFVVNAWAGPGDTSARRIEQDGKVVYGPGDVTLFYHDPIDNRFLGIFKFFTSENVGPARSNLRSRAYHFLDRLDEPFDSNRIERIALLPPAEAEDNDGPADEFYASTAWRYESLWLGGLKVWHGKDDYPHSENGCAFFKLVVSRDGLNWHKVPFKNDAGVPEVFIPNGPQGGNNGRNDGGYMSEFSQGPLRIGDELIYYYSSSSWGKNAPSDKRIFGGGIFRARLRVDGFVSVVGGTLTTKPLAITGRDLFVNAVGPVSVSVLAGDGKVLGETSIVGDSLRHQVRFGGRTLADLAGGRPVRLRFTVAPPGHLYSFTVR